MVSDRNGRTAGDCDVVIFNDTWFPSIKQRATLDDRQHVMPIEGVYAVLEVKQTLSLTTLDEAMKKLVICKRLDRPENATNQITENRPLEPGSQEIGNPLFSAIVAVKRDHSTSLEELVSRFIKVNQKLDRKHMIQCLCILGEACYFWGWAQDGASEAGLANFRGLDLHEPLIPIQASPDRGEPPLGALISRLFGEISNTVLATPSDIPHYYGSGRNYQPLWGGIPLIPAPQQREESHLPQPSTGAE
ncbi:hypothetical protein GCM10010435_76970 [Winogradskya consettensis]|uniref:DUF6602 domain-containing protein n=2 Tax=Winogradskya consettensis TaxID=113560 RepID=A0A919VSW0_9ACTN|nr:hypothetical protein Aco04nite_41180 [Actinoplanes consettensis]